MKRTGSPHPHLSSASPPAPVALMALPGGFLDSISQTQSRTRFNLLLLEHGEVYFGDYAVIRYRLRGRAKIKVPGRLKVSSRSLVFEPVGDVSQPLLRFSYKHIASLLRYTPRGLEALEWGEPSLDGLFIFSCSTVAEIKANDLVGPYVQKKCGGDTDNEGPDFVFRLQHTPLPDFLALVGRLLEISTQLSKTGATAHAEETLLRPLLEERERLSAQFDPVHLVDFREKMLLPQAVVVDRISPLIKNPGVMMLTDKRFYFQPAELNNVGISIVSYALTSVVHVFKRRYMLRQAGLEIFIAEGGGAAACGTNEEGGGEGHLHIHNGGGSGTTGNRNAGGGGLSAGFSSGRSTNSTHGNNDGPSPTPSHSATSTIPTIPTTSILLSFRSSTDRDHIYDLLLSQPELAGGHLLPIRVAEVTRQWQARQITNLDYLAYLNTLADRSYNDLTQYPVFPWVISDYSSKKLDLDNPQSYRDLSKPIGALNQERLTYLRERFRTMPEANRELGLPPRFLYGTHYSTPGYVLFYLVRAAPEYMLCLQDGKFDAADRMFGSVGETWRSCLTNPADLKELIPEFYCSQGEFLRNIDDLPLGTTQGGVRVGDVVLPPWAKNERDFVRKLRKALNESDYVSEHLHEWIDLIFGYKQKGEAAVAADNLFYYLTYEGAVDLEKMEDPVERAAVEAQIREFGQTPKQVFIGPHPRRDEKPGSSPILLAPAFQDPSSSSTSLTPSSTAATAAGSAAVAIPISTESGNGSAGLSNSFMRPRGGSEHELEGTWEMVRRESLSVSLSASLSQSQSMGTTGWEMLKEDIAEVAGAGQDDVMSLSHQSNASISANSTPLSSPVYGASGGIRGTLSPKALMAKGLGLAGGGGGGGGASASASASAGSSSTSAATMHRQNHNNDGHNQSSRSLRLDADSQRVLDDMIRQASTCKEGGRRGGEENDDEANLPSVVRLEDLLAQNLPPSPSELQSGVVTPRIPLTPGMGNITTQKPILTEGDTHTQTRGEEMQTKLQLVGSAPLALHRDKVTSIKLADGGKSLYSTSEDGSFRVSTLTIIKDEDKDKDKDTKDTLEATLRSKRHFSPSEIALSCCALVEEEDEDEEEEEPEAEEDGKKRENQEHDPLAVLGSYDNHVYLFSVNSARQILKLDAHDDALSCLDVKGALLATGSWDATVKVWSLFPPAGGRPGVDPLPVAEFFDHAKQVQSVALYPASSSASSSSSLLAAGAEDGHVIVWDAKSKSMVSMFEVPSGAPVTAVRWANVNEDRDVPSLFVCGADGYLGLYSVEGKLLRSVSVDGGLRCLELCRASDGTEVLVTGSADGSLRLWASTALGAWGWGGELRPLAVVARAHEEAVTCLAFNWKKGRIVSGGGDGSVRVWKIQKSD